MKGKKHRPEQIIQKLREADAMLALGKRLGQVVPTSSTASAVNDYSWLQLLLPQCGERTADIERQGSLERES